MAVSVLDIRRLRRMIDEADNTIYTDEELVRYLGSWPLVDTNGLSADDDNDNWQEAYDLHAAAADIWEEKAASYQTKHDFSADGSSFSASQMYTMAMTQAKHHRASQKATVKKMPNRLSRATYFPEYENPIYDEDEEPEDWNDLP